jgi:ribosome-binding factor A
MQGRRLSRLGDQIQEEISDIIHRKLRDPRLGFTSITKVRVAADLSRANVYVSVMGAQDEIDRSIACLDGAASFIRSELGGRLRIKRIPEIRFHYDDSCVKGARIDSILRQLRESGDGQDFEDDK